MTQSRRPAGTPVGGQFAPTNRPEATGIELVDDDLVDATARRVEVMVAGGLPSFAVEGLRDRDCRETRDRVRAALLSSDLPWPLRKVTVCVAKPAPERSADLDLEIALGILQASGHLPDDADVSGLRGELGLDGSIRGEATTDARSLRALVDALTASSGGRADDLVPSTTEIVPVTETAAESAWRLFRESYGGWLDLYRKSRYIGGLSDTERRLREAAGLAGVDEAQLRADKARAYRGETSEQILEGR